MTQKEDQEKVSRLARKSRRSIEKREKEDKNSLAAISTPVDSFPNQKKSNPEDTNQERKLSPIQENIVTAAAASGCVYNNSSEDSSKHSGSSNVLS